MFCLAVYVIDFCQSCQTKSTKFANNSPKLLHVFLKLVICQDFSKLPHVFFKFVIYAKQVCKILFKVVTCISQTCYMYLSKLSHAFLALCQTKPAEVWPRFWSVLKLLLCCWMNLVVKFTNFVSCTAIYDLFQMSVRALNAWVRSVFGNVE